MIDEITKVSRFRHHVRHSAGFGHRKLFLAIAAMMLSRICALDNPVNTGFV
jgi:hypothetical protein